MEGGCQVPVGAYAVLEAAGSESQLRLQGRVLTLSGDRKVEGWEEGSSPDEATAEAIGVRLASRLCDRGAGEILSAIRAGVAPSISEP